ncbi:MAG: helix-turn-helix transcriptional regulator [Lachnospiraceae bacterium]
MCKSNSKRKIPISNNSQAVFPYGKYGFPCELYNDNIDDFDNCTVEWHWQLELEFAIVQNGSIDLFVQKDVIRIREHEGYIIFPNQLHCMKKSSNQNGIYKTIILDPQFIYGDNNSILFYKYYLSVVNALSNGFIILNDNIPHSKNIIEELNNAIKLLMQPTSMYELEIHKHFINIWSSIYDSVQKIHFSNLKISARDEALTEKILLFIHSDYLYDICLGDIAKSGNISKAECNRLFQRTLSCTPFEYLTKYRISKSQEFLGDESYSITDIAGLVGFNSVNYYTTVFKKHIGYTPSQYKKLLKQSFN